jgi:predicted nucleic acid-binding protein
VLAVRNSVEQTNKLLRWPREKRRGLDAQPNLVEISMSNPSSKNALVHGYYAEDVVLKWEQCEEFEELFADLCREFTPEGRMEEEILFDVAHLRWQKRRVRKMWHAATLADQFVVDLTQSGAKSWSAVRDYLQGQAKDARTVTETLHQLHVQLLLEAKVLSEELIKKRQQKSETQEIQLKIEGLVRLVADQLVPLREELQKAPSAIRTFHDAYSPQYLEPILRLEASIDARIDKALGRFVPLKEYKRLAATYKKPPLAAPQLDRPAVTTAQPAPPEEREAIDDWLENDD